MTKNIKKHKSTTIWRNVIFLFTVALMLILSSGIAQSVKNGGASFFLSPSSETFKVGDTFSMELKINATGIPINSAQAVIHFSTDILEVLNISKDDSIFSLWPEEPVFSNSDGKISFAGGLPHPGFQETGNIITINFKAKKQGLVRINFGQGKILADDGKGTNVLVFLKEAKYFVQEREISFETEDGVLLIFSSTHPEKDEWYNNNNPSFQWTLMPDMTGVSLLLDQNSDTVPDEKSEGLIQSKSYEGISDGVWYFHLRLKNETAWTQPVHYKVQIDSLSPHPFEVTIDNIGDTTNPKPDLYFETEDDISGISRYELKIGEGEFYNLLLAQINPFSIPIQDPGTYQIIVRAVDMAGNSVQAKSLLNVEPIDPPVITVWSEKYIAGEEVFYIEGQAFPGVEIVISLRKNGQDVKEWQTQSNEQGEWAFSTKELVKSGTYDLSAKAQDERGAVSDTSDVRKIEVLLSGLSLGIFTVSFKNIILFLLLILFLGIILTAYFIYKVRRTKKILLKETQEAEKSLYVAFEALEKKIKKEIEMLDLRPGLSKEEEKLYNSLKKDLEIVQDFIAKEIEDIEKKLG